MAHQYLDKEWDILIVLDACRHDIFEREIQKTGMIGSLSKMDSGATCTFKWYLEHWSEPVKDVILISESPIPFADLSNRTAKNFSHAVKSWDGGKTDPQRVIDDYFKWQGHYRYILHLMPPHLPFIGLQGQQFMCDVIPQSSNVSLYVAVQSFGRKGKRRNFEILRELYAENVRAVLNILKDNRRVFGSKKVVITSDHGELIGEDNRYDHPTTPPANFRKLQQTVPWFEWDVEETDIHIRMKALGYV